MPLSGCSLLQVCEDLPSVRWSHSQHIPQILRDCIPPSIFTYLDASEEAPVHHHKSIIANLSCGPSINLDRSRHGLYSGYGQRSIRSCLYGLTISP